MCELCHIEIRRVCSKFARNPRSSLFVQRNALWVSVDYIHFLEHVSSMQGVVFARTKGFGRTQLKANFLASNRLRTRKSGFVKFKSLCNTF